MSKVLVVVCTRSSAQSALVDSEVGLFVRYGGGAIIPVQLDCPVEECGWRRHIRGLPANRRSGRRLPILNAHRWIISALQSQVDEAPASRFAEEVQPEILYLG